MQTVTLTVLQKTLHSAANVLSTINKKILAFCGLFILSDVSRGVNKTEIDLQTIADGIYLVELSGESFHVTKKISVSH